jgi:predicted acetyltransferase
MRVRPVPRAVPRRHIEASCYRRTMSIQVRTIGADELPRFIETLTTAFLERPDVAAVGAAFAPHWDLERAWAAFDGDRMCGTFRSWASELTVPGGARLPAACMAAVTVLPTHRRRGILRALTAAEHGAMRERGEVFGLLHAAEFPIYGRFGYGPATWTTMWVLDTRNAGFVVDPSGTIELVTPSADVRDQMRQVYEVWRLREPASLRRRDFIWDVELGLSPDPFGQDWKGFVALHRDSSNAVDGYVRYRRSDDHWDAHQPRNVLQVDELMAITDGAHADLWRFLAEMDWVAKVKAEWRSPSDRLPWLLANARAAAPTDDGDDLWVRIHDVPRALEARTYERADRLVLEVIDREAAGSPTRVELDGGPDGARCGISTATPDLTLDLATLGAVYLGGTPLRNALVQFGGEEHRPGAIERLDGMMRTLREPWCTTFF